MMMLMPIISDLVLPWQFVAYVLFHDPVSNQCRPNHVYTSLMFWGRNVNTLTDCLKALYRSLSTSSQRIITTKLNHLQEAIPKKTIRGRPR